MDINKIIIENIPEPGLFICFRKKENYEETTKNRNKEPKFLNLFKEKQKADIAYNVYSNSKQNAISLLKEAELLSLNNYFSRAVTLAIMSYEELGKSQIAADYYSGILPEDEYLHSFKTHRKTSFSSRHAAIGQNKKIKYGLFIDDDNARNIEKLRQLSIYVDEQNHPLELFTMENSELIISKVKEHIEYILYAEEFNGRIGSKALFK